MTNQSLGKRGEEMAEEFLKKKNFVILFSNYRTKLGEIDIIARKDKTIYFIEVKTRYDDRKGKPYEAVDSRKISHLKKAAYFFLLQNDYKNYKLKLGVVSILLEKQEIKFYDDIY